MNCCVLANNSDEMEKLDQDLFNANDQLAQTSTDINDDESLDMLACIAGRYKATFKWQVIHKPSGRSSKQ